MQSDAASQSSGQCGQEPNGQRSQPFKVLFCGDEFPQAFEFSAEELREEEGVQVTWCAREYVFSEIRTASVVIPRMTRLSADIIDAAEELKLIVQFGVGLEGVDVAAATRRGIAVARIPSHDTGNAASCAEHCVYLLLSLLRDQKRMQWAVANRRLGEPTGQTLFGKTICIVGFGGIGQALAARLRPFGVRIIAVRRAFGADAVAGNGATNLDSSKPGSNIQSSPSPLSSSSAAALADERVGLEQLPEVLSRSDAVIMCCLQTKETMGMVNEGFIRSMKKGAFLINIARGGLLNYEAVRNGLESGHLGGLGIDVAWVEPMDPNDPVVTHPKTIITPHIGGVTQPSYRRMAQIIRDTVLEVKDLKPLTHVEVVNGL